MSRFKPSCDHALPEAMQPQCNGNCRKEPPTRKGSGYPFSQRHARSESRQDAARGVIRIQPGSRGVSAFGKLIGPANWFRLT
jgi:hypothetical protein